jgi:CheY-like chemotaxis protein
MTDDSGLPWVVEFHVSGSSVPAKLTIHKRAVIGRKDPARGTQPDLDLSKWSAMELGVAPEHVAIDVDDDQLTVLSLSSDQPTLLNGNRLGQTTPQVLNHGDDLQLGVLHLQVKVEASPNQGSVVLHQSEIEITQEATSGQGQTILIVEDEPATSQIFKLVMERAGFKVHVCREVVSAIRMLNSEAPSAIILDLMLPDIHGLELCRYIRRDIEQRNIPIVIVSAAVTQTTIAQSMEVGANVFLGKPVSMNELVRVVTSLVNWYDARMPAMKTRNLAGTAQLRSMPSEIRKDALVFFVTGYQEPVPIIVPSRVTLGRRTGGSSGRPHIDLDRYGAFDAGVSRMHAAISRENDGFYIEDLESSNGTFVNNRQIVPHEPYLLENAAEVILGNLHGRIFFFTEDDKALLPDDPPVSEDADQE